jgi:type I restriction enzyme S subunit
MSELPNSWVATSIGVVAEVLAGRTPGRFEAKLEASQRGDRTVPFYKVGDMNAAPTFMDDARVLFAKDEAATFGITILGEGSVVFPKAGGAIATNKKRIIRTPGGIDLNCMSVTAKEWILPRFLFYFFDRLDLTSLSTGSVLPQIGKKAVESTCLSLPPLAEQQRIVEILEEQFSRLDAALASIRTVREKAAAFRRSLLQAAFHGALAGDSAVSIPSDWSLLSLDEVSEVRLGRQRSPRNHSGPQLRPYLRAANVTWQGLDLTDVKEMNFSDEELSVLCLKSGDILVGEASGSPNEVGKAAVFQGEIENCCFQNTLLRVRPLSIDTRYLHYFLTGTAMSGAYARESRGVGISHLGRAKLASWPVPVAPAPEQQRIGEMLDEQFSRLDAALVVTNQLEARIVSERRSLLHAAFSGALTEQWRTTHNG